MVDRSHGAYTVVLQAPSRRALQNPLRGILWHLMRRTFCSTQLVDDVSEELVVRRDDFMFRKRHRNPGFIDQISPRDIIVCAIASPRATAQ